MYAVIDRESCFAGTLYELALAADRIYMLDADDGPTIALSITNFGLFPALRDVPRIAERFSGDAERVASLRRSCGETLDAGHALALGLVTAAPDEIDWEDELRIALEERASFSPDALTGMEQNLRFGGGENMATRIFGRLSAWQNWIFTRPNATGDEGALSLYGRPERPVFDWRRT
jgi:benzoyl-CoA-dihydrodiol lyase